MSFDALLAPPPQAPKLLVVDDQPLNIQALYSTFSGDHKVYMATTGAQALQVAAQQRPDLILLDLELPDQDGLSVCRQLKGQELTRDIPVIFVTAYGNVEVETAGLEAGAVDFIHKPLHPPLVRARVRTHLTLKRQADTLRRMAFIDGLTGLHNRRALDERLEVELRHAARNQQPLALALIDVDHFKLYNDHQGHQAGDEALRRVGMALQACMLRPVDLAARYGGEELACLLPQTDAGGAQAVGERLRAAIEALALPHPHSPVAPVLTISVGVASGPGRVDGDPQPLLRAADAALYAAKHAGRNCVRTTELA